MISKNVFRWEWHNKLEINFPSKYKYFSRWLSLITSHSFPRFSPLSWGRRPGEPGEVVMNHRSIFAAAKLVKCKENKIQYKNVKYRIIILQLSSMMNKSLFVLSCTACFILWDEILSNYQLLKTIRVGLKVVW